MSWTILGLNEWAASDSSDGLPITGTRAWPAAANTAGDLGIMVLAARDTASPPGSGLGDWTLIDSYTSGDVDSNGLRNFWVYYVVRGGSNPAMPGDWVTSYSAHVITYRHSSETTFTIGTPVEAVIDPASTTHSISGGISSPGTDSLIIVAGVNGRDIIGEFTSTTPSTGVTGDTEDTTTAPSTTAWRLRAYRTSGASPGTHNSVLDCVLDSGSTGTMTATVLSTKGVLWAVGIKPGSGGGGGSAIAAILSNYKRRRA
jgi:hypothetical protein